MWFQVRSFLNYLWLSQNQHGVHSPFVFKLLTDCFYDRSHHPEFLRADSYRKSLLSNHNRIEVDDFGAGSKVFDSNIRKISAIAKNAGTSHSRLRLLTRLVKYFNPATILELGSSVGLATAYMAAATENCVVSVEGCANTALTARENLASSGFSNTEIVTSNFENFIENIDKSTRFGMIYFDGNHRLEPTLDYFERLLPTATNDSVWIFDDIHWSQEMELAWETIKTNPKVTVTIDTYQWGFVFFRAEQQKEHFVLRC